MILYLILDSKKGTTTFPLVANQLSDAQDALKQINPENLSDLKFHVIGEFTSLDDLKSLTFKNNRFSNLFKKPSDFKLNYSTEPVGAINDI